MLAEYRDHTGWVRFTAATLMAEEGTPPPAAADRVVLPPAMHAAIVERHDGMYQPNLSNRGVRGLGFGLALAALTWIAVLIVRLLRLGRAVQGLARLAALGIGRPRRRWRSALELAQRHMGIRAPIGLHSSTRVGVPVVYGWRRPVILVPAASQGSFSFPEAQAILAHELAHVRRWDGLMTLAQAVAEAVLWYQPAAPWLSRRISEERECCADDLACRSNGIARRDLGKALLKLETARPPLSLPTLAAMGRGGSLVRRITRLSGGDASRARIGPRSMIAAVVVALGAAVLLIVAHSAVPATEHIVMQHDLQVLKDLTVPPR